MLVSIVIPTRNSANMLSSCLKAVKKQTYKKIEIIISDGGSTDDTLSIAKKFNCRAINNSEILAEPGVYYGMRASKGDIIIILAVDNFFKHNNSIERIVEIFQNKKIYAAFPKHESSKEDSFYSKYMNTFTDPFNHYLYGYAANARTFKKIYKTLDHSDIYDIYDYKSSNISPIIALAQGFTVRQEFIKYRKDKFDDISPVLDLIEKDKIIAYLHSIPLLHHTVKNLNHFIRKQRWAVRNSLKGKKFGINSRMHTLSFNQEVKIYLFPLYSLSIILPLFRAIYGLIVDREIVWLLHPFITFVAGLAIVYEFARIKVGLDGNVSRQ